VADAALLRYIIPKGSVGLDGISLTVSSVSPDDFCVEFIPFPLRHTTLALKFNVIDDMVQGFRYITSWKGLLYLIIVFALLNFFLAPLNVLSWLFVNNYLAGDVLKMGLLGTALGLGISIGGLILSSWGGFKKHIYTIFSGLIIWCIVIFVFGFTTERSFYLGLAMWFTAGLCNAFANSPVATILQSTVPKDMQGRVFTTMGSLCTAMFIPSLLIAGPVAQAIGVRAIYQISGAVMLPIVIISLFSKILRNIEKKKH